MYNVLQYLDWSNSSAPKDTLRYNETKIKKVWGTVIVLKESYYNHKYGVIKTFKILTNSIQAALLYEQLLIDFSS